MDRGDWPVTIHRVIKSQTQVTHHSTQLTIIPHTLPDKKEQFNDIYIYIRSDQLLSRVQLFATP